MDSISDEIHSCAPQYPGWDQELTPYATPPSPPKGILKDSLSPESLQTVLKKQVELNWQPSCPRDYTTDQDYHYPEFRHYVTPLPLRHKPSLTEEHNHQSPRPHFPRQRPRPSNSATQYRPQPDRYPPCYSHWARCPTPTKEEKGIYEQQWQDSEARRETRRNIHSFDSVQVTSDSKIEGEGKSRSKSEGGKTTLTKHNEDAGVDSDDDINARLIQTAAKVAEEVVDEIARQEWETSGDSSRLTTISLGSSYTLFEE
jgi:hypothetical protein